MEKIFRSRAPLRISFAGGGTDVPPYPELYGGAVISTTIDRYAYITMKKNSKKGIRVISQDYNLLEKLESVSDLKIDGKMGIVKAAIVQAGLKNEDIDIIIHADSPPGSGLGSSSAVSVSLIGCIANYMHENLSTYDIAERAIKLEREIVGIKGGYQDQYASAFGGFNFIEFKKTVTVNPLRLRPEILHELLASLILIDTGKTRLSGNILQKQIQQYEKKDTSTLEHLEVIKSLVHDVKECLLKGKMIEIGYMLDVYWKHKKSIDKGISNPTIDKIYDKVKKAGALGGKILGAGGGGHMLFLCDPDKRHQISRVIDNTDATIVKFNFDKSGLQTWVLHDKRVVY